MHDLGSVLFSFSDLLCLCTISISTGSSGFFNATTIISIKLILFGSECITGWTWSKANIIQFFVDFQILFWILHLGSNSQCLWITLTNCSESFIFFCLSNRTYFLTESWICGKPFLIFVFNQWTVDLYSFVTVYFSQVLCFFLKAVHISVLIYFIFGILLTECLL